LAYKIKKLDLGGIIGMVGLAGIVSGFIYGSFFGNEEIIPRLFGITTVKPMESIMPLLIGTVCMGVVIIIMGMCLNVRNMFKLKQYGEAIFGHNGIAGILFYLSVITVALNLILKLGIPSFVFAITFTLSLLAVYLCEPLSKLVEGKKNWFPKNAMFFVENLFELFEVVLSFVTNTISFLRIGAFAIIHVGMMMAVAALSGGGGARAVIVTVVGNIIVMVLEALIVAIQVLRLEYYEMFSRYFVGGGKEFVSLKDK
jgi:V/A-type H+-transporting ATPase subunit I